MKFDRDLLTNADRGQAAQAAFAVIDRLQQLPKQYRVLGGAISFLLLMEHLEVDPQDAFTTAKNVMVDPQDGMTRATQFTAIQEYLANEA